MKYLQKSFNSGGNSKSFVDNWDKIFGEKEKVPMSPPYTQKEIEEADKKFEDFCDKTEKSWFDAGQEEAVEAFEKRVEENKKIQEALETYKALYEAFKKNKLKEIKETMKELKTITKETK